MLRSEADVRVANLECCISARGSPWSATPKVFHFRAVPEAIEVLRAARTDAVSLANNHSLDFGPEALSDTLAALGAAGICAAGARQNIEEARRPICLQVPGAGRLSFVAWTDNEPPFAAGLASPGTNYLTVGDPGR